MGFIDFPYSTGSLLAVRIRRGSSGAYWQFAGTGSPAWATAASPFSDFDANLTETNGLHTLASVPTGFSAATTAGERISVEVLVRAGATITDAEWQATPVGAAGDLIWNGSALVSAAEYRASTVFDRIGPPVLSSISADIDSVKSTAEFIAQAVPDALPGSIGGLPLSVDSSGRVDVLKVNGTTQTALDVSATVTATNTRVLLALPNAAFNDTGGLATLSEDGASQATIPVSVYKIQPDAQTEVRDAVEATGSNLNELHTWFSGMIQAGVGSLKRFTAAALALAPTGSGGGGGDNPYATPPVMLEIAAAEDTDPGDSPTTCGCRCGTKPCGCGSPYPEMSLFEGDVRERVFWLRNEAGAVIVLPTDITIEIWDGAASRGDATINVTDSARWSGSLMIPTEIWEAAETPLTPGTYWLRVYNGVDAAPIVTQPFSVIDPADTGGSW